MKHHRIGALTNFEVLSGETLFHRIGPRDSLVRTSSKTQRYFSNETRCMHVHTLHFSFLHCTVYMSVNLHAHEHIALTHLYYVYTHIVHLHGPRHIF